MSSSSVLVSEDNVLTIVNGMSMKKFTPGSDFLSIINRISDLLHLRFDSEVADFLGMKKSNFSQRKRRNTVPYDEIKRLCEEKNLSLEYILYGTGSPEGSGSAGSSNIIPFPPPESQLDEDFVFIPQVSGRISAGVGPAPENDVDVRVAFRKSWIKKKGSPDKMSLIKVKGDSMEPTLVSGDMILVDHGRNFIDPQGGIYAIAIDDMIMIKRVQVLGQGRIRVVSDNPRYEPIEMNANELIINGKVFWYCRDLER